LCEIQGLTLSLRSLDDIPAVLKGLQHIYVTDHLREKVFILLDKTLNPLIKTTVGRPGMALWQVFVLAMLKLGLNCDDDRLQELVNEHRLLRQMLSYSG